MTAVAPVHDLDAEAAVLSALMLDLGANSTVEQWADVRDTLRAGDFFNQANRQIFEAVAALHANGLPVDTVTVASELQRRGRLIEIGGQSYLIRLCDAAPVATRAGVYAAAVSTTARQRRMMALGQRIAAEGHQDVGDVDEWVAKIEVEVRTIAQGGASSATYETVGEVLKGAVQKLEDDWRNGTQPQRVTTGISSLDEKLTMTAGDLIVVGARPGMGKTALVGGAAIWMASSATWPKDLQAAWAAEDPAVLVFSQEMPKEQIALRCLCSDARVDLSAMRRGHVEGDDWKKLVGSSQRLSTLPLWIDDKPGISTDYVRKTIRSLKRDLKRTDVPGELPRTLRLVIVDYLQLMKLTGSKNATKSELVGNTTRALKCLAKEEDLVIILLSQLNRSVETRDNKRPTLSDLRDSGEIEQDADAVVFLYRDGYYNKDSRHPNVAEAIIAKQRNGGEGRVVMQWEGRYTLFSELSESDKLQLRNEAVEQPKKSKTGGWL